jgi:hypothetical protein
LGTTKLKLIRAELDRRGEGLHQDLHQTIERHATSELDRQGEDQHQFVQREATLNLGVGVNTIASLSTSSLASYAVADYGTRAVHDSVQNPSGFPRTRTAMSQAQKTTPGTARLLLLRLLRLQQMMLLDTAYGIFEQVNA